MAVSYEAGGGEPGYIAPDPRDPDMFYSGTNNGGYLDKFNRRTGHLARSESVSVVLLGRAVRRRSRSAGSGRIPIIFSQVDPKTLYVSSQRLWRTTDGGKTWTGAERRPHAARTARRRRSRAVRSRAT